jgi:23S rRNA pseudouridine2605 synthase
MSARRWAWRSPGVVPLDEGAAAEAESGALGRGAIQEVAEAADDPLGRRGDDDPAVGRGELGEVAGGGDDRREPAGEGLEDRHAEALAVARQDEGVGRAPGPPRRLAGDVAEAGDPGGDARLLDLPEERRQGARRRGRPAARGGRGARRRASRGPRPAGRAPSSGAAGRGTAGRTCRRAPGIRPPARRGGGNASKGARSTPLGTKPIGARGARARRWPISGRDRACRQEARRRFFPSTSAV